VILHNALILLNNLYDYDQYPRTDKRLRPVGMPAERLKLLT
jgi:hypothetical protein